MSTSLALRRLGERGNTFHPPFSPRRALGPSTRGGYEEGKRGKRERGKMVEGQSLPGMEGMMNPLDEAQMKSALARRVFEVQEGYAPWMDDYWRLMEEGWPWRQAVYMLWSALPGDKRQPKTQQELAIQVLGLTTDRVIREWKQNPAVDAEIARLASSALAKHRPEIYAALIESATNPNPRAHADRRMALEMLGDYDPKLGLTVTPGGKTADDLSEMSDEELRALEQGPGS